MGPFLEKRGIKALINLRGRNDDLSWWKKETGAAAARGIAHLDAMLDSRKLPTRAMLMRLIEAFDERPAALSAQMLRRAGPHQFRGGALSHPSRRLGGHGPRRDAQFARFPYLHFPKKHQRWLKLFLDFAAEDAHGDAPGQLDFASTIRRSV